MMLQPEGHLWEVEGATRRGMARRRKWSPLNLPSVILVLLAVAVPGTAQLQDESAVKAAYVYNLTKYVQWPQPGSELIIAFVGDGPMGNVLKQDLDGKTTAGRPIRVLVSPSDEQLVRCQLLYVDYSSSKQVHAVLQKVSNKEILTVGDWDSFTKEGGMVGLVRSGAQIQIQINEVTAGEARLTISSRLLHIATIVRSAPWGKS